MSEFDPVPLVSAVISLVVALLAIIWLLPIAVTVTWELLPSIVILLFIVAVIRAIITRFL